MDDSKTESKSDEVAPPLISSKPREESASNRTKSAKSASKAAPKKPQQQTQQPPGNVRKTVVVPNDKMLEMVKQAKALKEERRSALDAKHHFIFSTLGSALNVEPNVIEDVIVGDERFDLIGEFCAAKGSKKLLFYYQENKDTVAYRPDTYTIGGDATRRLFLTDGKAEPLTGTAFFFIRLNAGVELTGNNIANEVTFGMLEAGANILDALEKYMSKIMVPAIKSQDGWGSPKTQAQVAEFLENMDKFIQGLTGAMKSMDDQVILDNGGMAATLEDLKTPSEYQTMATNAEFVEQMEKLLASWAKQIEHVLSESEQMRREADDIGPSAELAYWRQRMAKFNSLLDQIKSARCRAVVGVLQAAKSKSLKQWKVLDSRITDGANEAKDNVRYLYTLERFFGPLSKSSPVGMIDLIPGLMNAVRMIHSVSQYYNTSERMTSLFIKITNQMITTCRRYIRNGVEKVWDLPREELLKRLEECRRLNREYQLHFHKTRDKLHETPTEMQWDFSENYIFGKFDAFCRRMDKLEDMIQTIDAFAPLQDMKLEGVDTISVKLKTVVDTSRKKTYDVLDHRKLDFENDYLEFKRQIELLNQQIDKFLDSWLDKNLTTEKCLDILTKFHSLTRISIDFNDKYQRVFQHYAKDLEAVRKVYQKNKADPSIARNVPPVAGRIAWARQLYRRIDMP